MMRNLVAGLVLISTGILAADLPEKFSKRIETAESTYQQAVAKADNTRFYAVQKANSDRVKVFKQVLTDATKAGDFDAATAIKERVSEAEASAMRSKPKDLVKFSGHEYAVVKDSLTWHQAKQRCQELGGHLVTCENDKEQDFVLALCRQHKVDVWLGLSNENHFKWTWITGEPAKIDASWKVDDPQREFFSGAMTYWKDTDSFNDHNLGAFLGFVCEWDQ